MTVYDSLHDLVVPSDAVVAANLSTRSVALRPLLPTDSQWCYLLMCGPSGARWRYRGRTPSPEQVAADLWRSVFVQYVVCDRAHGDRPIGLVGLYNAAPDAGRAHGFAVSEPGTGPLACEAFGLMCSWAFEQFDLQRIFLETPEFNLEHFASLGDAAVVEGRLRNYEFWRGRFWDLFILTLTVETFRARFDPLLQRRQGPPAAMSGVTDDDTELRELICELWPLDSLGTIEVLTALEEHLDCALTHDLLVAVTADTAEEYCEQLLAAGRRAAMR